MKYLLAALGLLFALGSQPAEAQFNGCPPGFCSPPITNPCLSGGGSPAGVLDGLAPTAAYSASRKLLTAYGGSFYTLTSSGTVPYVFPRANTIFDQSGAARNLGPPLASGPPLGCTNPTSFQFYDPWQTFSGDGNMSDFISTTSGYIIASVKINTGNANNAGNCYGKEPILQDSGSNSGITLWNWTGGTTGYVCFHLWDGGPKEIYMGPISNNTPYVFEWRKESGVMYGRVNGGSEQALGVGTTIGMGTMIMGARPLCCILDSYIYEAATWITPPTFAQRNAIALAFGTYIGATMGTMGVTWDTATASSVTFTNGNLTGEGTGGATDHGMHVPFANAHSSGKYYYEETLDLTSGGGNNSFGVGLTTATYAGLGAGGGANGAVIYFATGNIWVNGSTTGVSLGGLAVSSTTGIAVDKPNNRIWFRVAPSGLWNNSGTADPATNTGGIAIQSGAMVPWNVFSSNGNKRTGNFGASAFVGAVPSGFNGGWAP